MSTSDPSTQWARDVVSGRIVAGKTLRAAADRHLKDLREGSKRGLFWDAESANHVINWFPSLLTITAGTKEGEPFNLLDPHKFLIGSAFGWRRADGRRRFRKVWFETGKGQGKSPLFAAVALYMMRFDGAPRFEGYAVAGNEDQAGVIMGEAAAMCRAPVPDEGVTFGEYAGIKLRGTGSLVWGVEWDGSDEGLGTCFFQTVSNGSSVNGPKPSLVTGDEVHEWRDPEILRVWERAIGKMPGNALIMLGTNTPSPDQVVGTTQSDYYTQVAEGKIKDDASLAVICTCDDGDDPFNDESVWRKSLPALDITFPSDNIRDEVAKARGMPSDMESVKRLFFGMRVGVADCWIEWALWSSVHSNTVTDFDEEELKSLPCWLGLDLSSREDLTALAAVWTRPDGHLLARVYYWTAGETMGKRERRDNAQYTAWSSHERRYLIATPGATIPKLWPATETKRMVEAYNVVGMVYDPAQFLDFEEACTEVGMSYWKYEGPDAPAGTGLMMISSGQGFKGLDNPKMLNMPTGVRHLRDSILNGNLTIEHNPLNDYCSGNMSLIPGMNPDNKAPNRRRAKGRIDGMVALIEAINGARTMGDEIADGASVYNDKSARPEGFLIL